MTSLLRVIKFAFQDMGRNVGMSVMTVFVLILMLLSVNVLWSMKILTDEAVKLVKDQVNISIYFNSSVDEKKINEIKKYVSSFPEVLDLKMSSADEVLKSFKERHKLSDDVMSALQELGSNPFGPTLVIKTREPQDYNKIVNALNIPEYSKLIEAKSYDQHQEAIEKIQDITNRIEKIVGGLTVLFAIISFLIIFNTIRVTIQTHRIEISIKRLVGANNWFIRGPYFVQSAFFALASVLATFGIIYIALRWVDPYVSVVLTSSVSLTKYYNSHIILMFAVQFVTILLLCVASSALAMRKQLKV